MDIDILRFIDICLRFQMEKMEGGTGSQKSKEPCVLAHSLLPTQFISKKLLKFT